MDLSSHLDLQTLAIGDELLTGKIADTNSCYVGGRLFEKGLLLRRSSVISDSPSEIREALERLEQQDTHVVCFGGLGPTSDDMTVEVVADWLGCGVTSCQQAVQKIQEVYKLRGVQVGQDALKQATYPEQCHLIVNPVGLAPGFWIQKNKATFYFLPGVPREMKPMFEQGVLTQILKLPGAQNAIFSKVWKCIGVHESELQRHVSAVEKSLAPTEWLGFRTVYPENHLTLYSRRHQASGELGPVISKLDEILKPWSYSTSAKNMEEVVIRELQARKLQLALAESCTGGLTFQRLSRVPGASSVLWAGLTTYHFEAKNKFLGLDVKNEQDAVSARTSRELAQATLEVTGVSITGAVTGYAGPSHAQDPQDAVGTVYLAVCWRGKCWEKKLELTNRSREQVQWGASSYLLDLLRCAMLE